MSAEERQRLVRSELLTSLRAGRSIARGAAGFLSRLASAEATIRVSGHSPAPAPEQEQSSTDRDVPPPDLDQSQAITLIYELLDAHLDTEGLAEEFEHDPIWSAHLSYLRSLQRYGREVLAQIGTGGTGT